MVSLEDKINELEERIKRNKEALIELDEIFYKFNGPAGYPTGTSWQDYDCIRGGNKEMDLFTYVTDRERLKTFIEIDEKILENLKRNQKLKEDIKLMPKNTDRIILMKSLGYSTKEISDELYLTPRYVRRVVQKYYKRWNNEGNYRKQIIRINGKKLIHDYDIDTTLSGFKLVVYIIFNYRKYYLWFDNINSIENLEQNIKNKISKEIIEKL